MKKQLLVLVLIIMGLTGYAKAKTVNLLVDQRNFYPFSYKTKAGQIEGIHIDIVKKALKELAYDVVITAYPRKRCYYLIKEIKADGMISVAYSSGAAVFFEFPPSAATDKRSEWRITQIDYMVATYRRNGFRYKGDHQTLPNSVRIPFGETFASDLLKEGFHIDEGGYDDRSNFRKLIRDKDGAVIVNSVMGEKIIEELNIVDQVTIHSIPFVSESYYLAFSKQDHLSLKEKHEIWTEIVHWRNDYVFMLQVFSKY